MITLAVCKKRTPALMIETILFYLFLICIFIQAVYYIIFLGAFLKYKVTDTTNALPVSVIICAHDEEENLKKLLPLLYEQKHDRFEIIVVEDRSNDKSYDFLLKESELHDNLKMVKVRQTPDHISAKKFALTLGIKAAKYDTLLLTDADCLPPNEYWIKNMTSSYHDETDIMLGFSHYNKLPGMLNNFIRFETIWTAIQYVGLAISGMPYMGVGRNLSYKKKLFLENKGFGEHKDVIGGDDDLFVNKYATRKNTGVMIGPDYNTLSIPKTSWKQYYRQKLRHLSVGKHYKFKTKLVLGLLLTSQMLIWPLFIGLLIQNPELYIIIASFLIRTLLMYLTFIFSCQKLGVRFEIWSLIFLDVILAFYYMATGLSALFTKTVRWS